LNPAGPSGRKDGKRQRQLLRKEKLAAGNLFLHLTALANGRPLYGWRGSTAKSDPVPSGLRLPRRRLLTPQALCAPRGKTQTCRMRRKITRSGSGRSALRSEDGAFRAVRQARVADLLSSRPGEPDSLHLLAGHRLGFYTLSVYGFDVAMLSRASMSPKRPAQSANPVSSFMKLNTKCEPRSSTG